MLRQIAGREVHVEQVVGEEGGAKVVFKGLGFHDKFTLIRSAGFYQPNQNEQVDSGAQQYVSRVACLGNVELDDDSVTFELHAEDVGQAVQWAEDELNGLDAQREQTRAIIGARKNPNLGPIRADMPKAVES